MSIWNTFSLEIFAKFCTADSTLKDLWLMTLSRMSASRFTEAWGRHLFLCIGTQKMNRLIEFTFLDFLLQNLSKYKKSWHDIKQNIKKCCTFSLKGTSLHYWLSRVQYSLESAMRKKTVIPLLAYLLLIAEVECEQKSKGNLILFLLSTIQPWVIFSLLSSDTGHQSQLVGLWSSK